MRIYYVHGPSARSTGQRKQCRHARTAKRPASFAWSTWRSSCPTRLWCASTAGRPGSIGAASSKRLSTLGCFASGAPSVMTGRNSCQKCLSWGSKSPADNLPGRLVLALQICTRGTAAVTPACASVLKAGSRQKKRGRGTCCCAPPVLPKAPTDAAPLE
nr:uncharacterized protein LOC110358048 isoform X2 [Columba livia]